MRSKRLTNKTVVDRYLMIKTIPSEIPMIKITTITRIQRETKKAIGKVTETGMCSMLDFLDFAILINQLLSLFE